MQLFDSFSAFNTPLALKKGRLLPALTCINQFAVTCGNCSFVNRKDYNFCTNCGFPIHPNKDRLALYNLRLARRKKLQKVCLTKIEHARNALYVLAACSMVGIFYVFSNSKQTVITGFVMIFLGLMYAVLGRWSLQKPFTSLLIGLIIMFTFFTINTLAEFTAAFTTAAGVYMLTIQCIFIYFLLRGVKAAFHADILEEEFKL